MPRDSETPRRRLTTPDPVVAGSSRASVRRSHSRTRRESGGYRSRSRLRSSEGRRELSEREREVDRQREHLRRLEDALREERSQTRRRAMAESREREKRRGRSETQRERTGHRTLSQTQLGSSKETDGERRSRSHTQRGSPRRDSHRVTAQVSRERSTHRKDDSDREQKTTQRPDRLDSPTFSCKDVANIINSLSGLKSHPQPLTVTTQSHSSGHMNHKNILPEFDPSSKSQRIDIWIKKVNECATVYGWDEKTVIHFAMQKLQGLAKVWYESLNSILFSWAEWQVKLTNAFPFDQNYGQSLEDMLRRRSRYNEPLEIYYYEKLALLNRCDIEGKRAVECIIHGLNDKTMRSSANALRCTQPDQLLHFLMSNREAPQPQTTSYNAKTSSTFSDSNLRNNSTAQNPARFNSNKSSNRQLPCYNCNEIGHPFYKCPKPLIQCTKCRRFGHKVESCTTNNASTNSAGPPTNQPVIQRSSIPKTMRIVNSESNSKFTKEIQINGKPTTSFIDFGSEVTLMTQTIATRLGLACDLPPTPLKGFGNEVVQSIGGCKINVAIDDVSADVVCHVVDDKFLDTPFLVGQSFTEQPHVMVFKNAQSLDFFCADDELPLPQLENTDDPKVIVSNVSNATLYGPAVVKARASNVSDGSVLLNGRLLGKPNQEYSITGGVYQVKGGSLYVQVSPLSRNCSLRQGQILCRGTRVQIVNRICAPTVNSLVIEHTEIDPKQVNCGDTINESQKQQLMEVLSRFKHCFAKSLKELGCTDMVEMNLELNSKRPIVYRPYRLSHKEREQVREMVGEMLDAGIVRESISEYASPIILVRKKDGKQRLCIDYRLLNSITVKERYPMPIIEDEIARLSGQAYFITLDLASGYYQVPISENSKPLTSFVTPDGQYEFNRMPFGLANAPAVFQRLMNRVLGSARFSEATAYIDDVLIYGKSVDECLERLERVMRLIEQANLTLNLSKCDFLQQRINYLGYEISVDGVRPGNKKIEAVTNFPRPTNPHSVRQFLGLVGYFRKFIRNFAALSHPLNKLLKNGVEWAWEEEQELAFEDLKNRLVDRPILSIFDPTAETELHTDASKVGVGGILMQRCPGDEHFRPVAYYSRQTSPEEKHFHAYELETLAVVCSLKKFRVYLLGQTFKIITDCSALRSTFSKRDIIPRIARWWLLLQEYQCTVEYRAGTKMSHVDALSRNPMNVCDPKELENIDEVPSVMQISGDDWLQTLQLGDSELNRIRDILTHDMDEESLKHIKDNYIIKDGKLYKIVDSDKTNLRWVVPKGARWQICRLNHDEIGHLGVEKTLERIKRTYWFPKMAKFVKKYVQACLECAFAKKTSTNEGHLHTIAKVEVPFHTLHIDHLGPFVRSKRGNSYLLVIVDAFTKFTFVRPVRNTKTQTTIRTLEDIFYTFRNPDRIISDRGTSFTSYLFKHFCSDKGIRHVLNAVACPRANGQVERYNRTILSSLTAQNMNFDEKNWDEKVGRVQWGINNTRQKSTGRTPAEVMFGVKMNSEINPILNDIVRETQEDTDLVTMRESVKDKIDEEQQKVKQAHDKNRRPARLYNEGDLVKITRTSFTNDGKSKKLISPYVGPYRVIAVLGNDRYRVAAVPGLSSTKNKRKTTVASDRMLPWVHVAALNVNQSAEGSEEEEHCTSEED